MKDIKFTKHPWVVRGTFRVAGAEIIKEGYTSYREGICDVEQGSYVGMSWEEKEANANLISAAPELLFALEDFVNSVYTGCTKDELNDMRIKAESVIKKALGKS